MSAADASFVHLHLHTSYSLLEGALTFGKLAELAKADRQPALAITDTDNLFGALEFSEKMAGAGIQPIIGSTLHIAFPDKEAAPRPGLRVVRPHLVLLAATEEGYRNLMALGSRAFLDPPSGEGPHVPLALLERHAGGLIALTGGPGGVIDKPLLDGRADLAAERTSTLASLFGDRLYIELQRHGLEAEKRVEPELVDIAWRLGLPVVATNEAYFARADDHEAHDALIAIAEGRLISETDRRRLTPEHRFKTRAEMAKLFADIPEAIASTTEIAQRCHARVRTRKPILPRFTRAGAVGAEAALDEAAELRRQAHDGLKNRLALNPPAPGKTVEDYEKQLDFELNVIERMKFPGYFLIVADFIKWAKAQGIPVGPGRGSGAGSLVAYSLTITDLDPLRFGLLFERFLNPERVSMPDFDIDFCQDRRDEVIRYVQERYGRDRVAQIITFGTLQARGVLRDVGRVLEMPFGQVDKLCKLVPQNPANPVTLAKALAEEPRLQAAREAEPVVSRAFDIAVKLEGLNRHASTHAAGIVIGDRELSELVPLYRDPKSDMPVTQFNMKWVEQAGLVKFDFLGLKTLSVLDTAVKLIARRGINVDLSTLPLDDPKTYQLLGKGETVGIFQLESSGMRKAISDIKPDRFEDIIALVALYRPGPMANIPVYGARKFGHEKPDYLLPALEPVLKETYGIIVYQEQVMQIAQILSGYSLGEADLLRRAMGKKIKKEMDAQRERFVKGCVERGIAEAKSNEIFDLLAKFADYGFNKSHAAAYALVAYHTAWLKANHPVEFLAASMTYEMTNTDKLAEFRTEAMRLGIKVVAPDVRRSHVTFDVAGGEILYALAAVKGVGAQACESIVRARASGPFRDLGDFARRIDPRALNKRVYENLASAGAFDGLEPDRARAHAAAEAVLALANRTQADQAAGQADIFGGGLVAPAPLPIPKVEPWTPGEKLQREHDAVGFYISGHPLDDYALALKKLSVRPWTDFARAVKLGQGAGRLAGSVLSRTERRTKTGNRMGIVALSDASGQYEIVLFAEMLQQYRDMLEPGSVVLLTVSAEVQGDEVRARVQGVERLDEAAARQKANLEVFLNDPAPIDHLAKRLTEKGDSEVMFVLMIDGAEVKVRLPGRYKVTPQLAGAMRAVPGVVEAKVA